MAGGAGVRVCCGGGKLVVVRERWERLGWNTSAFALELGRFGHGAVTCVVGGQKD